MQTALAPGLLRRIHHIALNMHDLDASRHFYGTMLGLHELTGPEVPTTLKTLVANSKVANFRTPDGTILDLFCEPELLPPHPDPKQAFTRANHLAFDIDPKSSHVIPALIHKIALAKHNNQHQLPVWGDGSPTREFLYVEDAAEGIVKAAIHLESEEPVNLGTGLEISIRDLVEKLCELMGFEGEIVWETDKPNGQPRRCLDTRRALESFGFQAGTSFEEGLRRTLEWHAAHRDSLSLV